MKEKSKYVMTVSLDQKLIKLIDEYAALTSRTRSSVVDELITLGFGVLHNAFESMPTHNGKEENEDD